MTVLPVCLRDDSERCVSKGVLTQRNVYGFLSEIAQLFNIEASIQPWVTSKLNTSKDLMSFENILKRGTRSLSCHFGTNRSCLRCVGQPPWRPPLQDPSHSLSNLSAAANRVLVHGHKEVQEQRVQRLHKKENRIKGWVSIRAASGVVRGTIWR